MAQTLTPRLWASARGLVLASIAPFCIYRLMIFQPLPLDSPGTLRPVLLGWFRLYTGSFTNSQDSWAVWKGACDLALVGFTSLALLNYCWRHRIVQEQGKLARILCSRSLFWSVYGACLLLCRYPVLLKNELNPDEGQFLAAACKLFYDPNFFHAVDCHTSGPGNIYPLMWPAIFGLSPDFASTRIVALVAIFLGVYLLYRTVALVADESLARIAILAVAAAFPVFGNRELVYYTSEHVPVLLISLALYLSVRIFVRPDAWRLPAFLLGLIVSIAFFTKLQSAPVVAASVLAPVAFLCANARRNLITRAALLFVAGALLPVLLNAALCLKAGVWHDFWQSYIISNVEYVDSNASLLSSLRSFLGFVVETPELRFFLITIFVLAIACLAQEMRSAWMQAPHTQTVNEALRWFGLLALLSSAAACFAVYKTHRLFVHYLLLLFIPLGMALAWMLIRHTRGLTILPYLTVALTLGCAVSLWSFQDRTAFDVTDMIRVPEGDFIRTVTNPGARIYVWGWTALPYLASGRIPAARETLVGPLFRGYNMMTSPPQFHSTPSSERVTTYYRGRELRDLETNRPELFIDAIGPASWFLSNRDYFGFEHIPEIAAFVNSNYVHLTDLYNERYFLRRDLAAFRDARFSVPLPPRACSAGAMRCLDTPGTLPRALPPLGMPAHARIEAEFVPVGSQTGSATVFSNEAKSNSFRGFRLEQVSGDRYILLVGLGNRWAVTREFDLPQGRNAFVTIEFDANSVRIGNNGVKLDELHLPQQMADADGPITIGSWIQGMDPFSGKIQFFQIVDLDNN